MEVVDRLKNPGVGSESFQSWSDQDDQNPTSLVGNNAWGKGRLISLRLVLTSGWCKVRGFWKLLEGVYWFAILRLTPSAIAGSS